MIDGEDAPTTGTTEIQGRGDHPGEAAAEVATEASIEGNTVSSVAKRLRSVIARRTPSGVSSPIGGKYYLAASPGPAPSISASCPEPSNKQGY